MSKALVLLIFLFPVFLSPENTSQDRQPAAPAVRPTPDAAIEIDSLSFDKKEAVLLCPGQPHLDTGSRSNRINVTTVAKRVGSTGLNYYYAVSGGRIIGQGANVVWEFDNTRPGTYEITVGVGTDNEIQGKTLTKTIDLTECRWEKICVCPTTSIIGPHKPVKPGSTVVFEAQVKGGDLSPIAYAWNVSGGRLTSGQKTSRIFVKTTPDMAGESLTVTVEITGFCPECPPTPSETILFTGKKPRIRPISKNFYGSLLTRHVR